jgi:CDP-paratose 2-epimerase
MPVAIITGAGGLIGSEAVEHFIAEGFDVVGVENDMRARFFGPDSSTAHVTERLVAEHPEFHWENADIRDAAAIERIFAAHTGQIELVIHTAAQPSHDWAASEPQTDFSVNANGTLNLLEAARAHCPDAPFIFCSTNKVYGDTPNRLPLEDLPQRLELPESHPYYKGIDTSMSIDASTHSLFGVSKAAADLLVQEYGRYFEMPTVAFRGGCLTGPQHAGAKLHGFLAYLMKCTVTGTPYTVFGYAGKQVRDNIHSADLIAAFDAYRRAPRPAAVYNIGGGRFSNCSMLEAIEICQRVAGRELSWEMGEEPRIGDHRWWISDLAPFQADYPDWELRYGVEDILSEMYEQNLERWTVSTP